MDGLTGLDWGTSNLREVFDYADGYVRIPVGPGLGIEINEAYVTERAAIGHRWHNPLWRHEDGSVAECRARLHHGTN